MEETEILASSSTTMSPTSVNTTEFELPIEMRFNQGSVVTIVSYSILIVFSAIGNFTVLVLILQKRGNPRSRINTMLMHLAIADLLVTFLVMPMEIAWAITVAWKGGDVMCRIMMFFRVFGIYLSSSILVCISVDRYYAILKPLNLTDVDRRGKLMLMIAWGASTLCSFPQMIVFHVEVHPNVTWFEQCVTINTFPSYTHELTYSLFGMVTMYVIPLIIIIYSYVSIIAEIYKRSKESFSDKIRRSSLGFLGRAKIRTLKMTVIIVLAFFVCWTPYYVMSFWYWVDFETARNVDLRIQKALFFFACTNSCMNPIVYGAFNIRSRKRDAGISQRVAFCASRSGKGAADVVCRFSWRRSLNESDQHRHTKSTKAAHETLGFISARDPPIVTINETQNNQAAGQQNHSQFGKQNCFTITPQPRTTIL